MTHTPGSDGCHAGVESTCPKCSPLRRQFDADVAASEAAWEAFKAHPLGAAVLDAANRLSTQPPESEQDLS